MPTDGTGGPRLGLDPDAGYGRTGDSPSGPGSRCGRDGEPREWSLHAGCSRRAITMRRSANRETVCPQFRIAATDQPALLPAVAKRARLEFAARIACSYPRLV